MPLSLNLPYPICYPLTLLARRVRGRREIPPIPDLPTYFQGQYRETLTRYRLQMGGLDLKGKTVLDVGSGLGGRALGWLELGASRVINIDIARRELDAGRAIVAERYPDQIKLIDFRHPDDMTDAEKGEVAILFDTFEHLVDPAAVLRQVHGWLRPNGVVWIGSFGWYNFMAGHVWNHIPIPWSQVVFSERAILDTIRKLVRSPGYTPNLWECMEGIGRWDEVRSLRDRPGEPLNMLSLRGVRRMLRESPFEVREFRVYGFSGRTNRLGHVLSWLSRVPVLEELFHSYYTALLVMTTEPVGRGVPHSGHRSGLARRS